MITRVIKILTNLLIVIEINHICVNKNLLKFQYIL